MIPSKRSLIDLAERAGATFAQAFLASITVNGSIGDLHATRLAAVAAGYAVAKFLIVKANAWLAKPAATSEAAAAPRPVVPGS